MLQEVYEYVIYGEKVIVMGDMNGLERVGIERFIGEFNVGDTKLKEKGR